MIDSQRLALSAHAVAIVTDKTRDKQPDKDGLFLIRHSAAHIMAEAIQDVLGKDVQLAYGPPTDTGFFYDMFVPENKKLSSDLFAKIDARIGEEVARYEYEYSGRKPILLIFYRVDSHAANSDASPA